MQLGPGHRVPHGQPQQDHGGRGGRHEQSVVEDPVRAAVVAPLRPEQPGQGHHTEPQREERPGPRRFVVLAEPAGLRRVQPLGGGQQHVAHLLVGVPEIGAAQRQTLPVVGPGALDQAGVAGEFHVEGGDLLPGPRRRVRVGGGLHQQPGRLLDVPLVLVVDVLRLLGPRQEAARRRGVGVRQRAVDGRRVGAQRLAAAHHVTRGGLPVGDLERRHGPERHDEQGQYGPDDLQPAGLGGGRGPHLAGRRGQHAATRRSGYGRGRGRRCLLVFRRRAYIRRVCHSTSPSVTDGGPAPGRSGAGARP